MKSYVALFTNAALIVGDFLTLTAPAGGLLRLQRIKIGPSIATAVGLQNIQAILRSQADTAGTSAAVSAGTYDSLDPAAGGTVLQYSAAPTTGGTARPIRAEKLLSTASGTSPVGNTILWTFDVQWGGPEIKYPVIHGGESLVLNCDAALAGQSVDGEIQWLEP